MSILNLPFWWVLARASGIAGYLLIVASMTSGVVLHTRLVQRLASPIARMKSSRQSG